MTIISRTKLHIMPLPDCCYADYCMATNTMPTGIWRCKLFISTKPVHADMYSHAVLCFLLSACVGWTLAAMSNNIPSHHKLCEGTLTM